MRGGVRALLVALTLCGLGLAMEADPSNDDTSPLADAVPSGDGANPAAAALAAARQKQTKTSVQQPAGGQPAAAAAATAGGVAAGAGGGGAAGLGGGTGAGAGPVDQLVFNDCTILKPIATLTQRLRRSADQNRRAELVAYTEGAGGGAVSSVLMAGEPAQNAAPNAALAALANLGGGGGGVGGLAGAAGGTTRGQTTLIEQHSYALHRREPLGGLNNALGALLNGNGNGGNGNGNAPPRGPAGNGNPLIPEQQQRGREQQQRRAGVGAGGGAREQQQQQRGGAQLGVGAGGGGAGGGDRLQMDQRLATAPRPALAPPVKEVTTDQQKFKQYEAGDIAKYVAATEARAQAALRPGFVEPKLMCKAKASGNVVLASTTNKDLGPYGQQSPNTAAIALLEAEERVGGVVPCPGIVNKRFLGDGHFHAKLSEKAYELDKLKDGDTFQINGKSLKIIKTFKPGKPTKWLGDYNAPAMLVAADDVLYLAVRGTWSAADAVTDAKFDTANFATQGSDWGHVHLGFLAALRALNYMQEVYKYLSQNTVRRIVTVGHSLGGAVAQLAAFEMHLALKSPGAQNRVRRIDCYTYGSPRVATTKFAPAFRARVNHYRYVFTNDLVTTVPIWGEQCTYQGVRVCYWLHWYVHVSDVAVHLTRPNDGKYTYQCLNDGARGIFLPNVLDHSLSDNYIPGLDTLSK